MLDLKTLEMTCAEVMTIFVSLAKLNLLNGNGALTLEKKRIFHETQVYSHIVSK